MDTTPLLFDQALIKHNQQRYPIEQRPDFIQKYMAQDLADRLITLSRQFEKTIIAGDWSGYGEDALSASGRMKNIQASSDLDLGKNGKDLGENSLDLYVSFDQLHMLNHVQQELINIKKWLKPDGLFLACFPGGETLTELRQSFLQAETHFRDGSSPRVIPFIDVQTAGKLMMKAGFALPVIDIETITIRYQDFFGLVNELRRMGMANPLFHRSKHLMSRSLWMDVARIYHEQFSDSDGRIRVTLETIWLSGWKPDPSQAKPAKRGSANISLAKVLPSRDYDT